MEEMTLQEAINQGYISKYCGCDLCINHPENINLIKEDLK